MFGDMMEKLQKMQQSVAESKAKLDNISVETEVEGIKVRMNGNRKLIDLQIPDIMMDDKEDLQDLLLTAFNKTLEKADKVNEAEMASSAKGLIPGL